MSSPDPRFKSILKLLTTNCPADVTESIAVAMAQVFGELDALKTRYKKLEVMSLDLTETALDLTEKALVVSKMKNGSFTSKLIVLMIGLLVGYYLR